MFLNTCVLQSSAVRRCAQSGALCLLLQPRRYQAQGRQAGFQLVEILIVMAIIGILAVITVPLYSQYRENSKNATAMSDISSIALSIDRFYIANGRYPNSLAEAGLGSMPDPWGHPYKYLRIDGGGLMAKGKLRKDKSLVPVNSDYDLYSMGQDGKTNQTFTAKASQDDIVRANNGRFVGLVTDY